MERLGPYDLLAELGRGGTSVVYRARHRETGGDVALKVFQPKHGPPDGVMAVLTRLSHANVVQILDVGREADRTYVAMELASGPTFGQAIRKRTLEAHECAAIVASIARGVEAAHGAGLVHRDIKPDNILLAADGTPKLSDFDLARLKDGGERQPLGTTAGTPVYMSPEQAAGLNDALDGRTDVYSLGAVLYEAVTGRPPYLGGATLDILERIRTEAPPPPRRRNPAVDPDLEAIILKAMERDPARRHPTPAALALELEQYVHAREPMTKIMVQRHRRRRREPFHPIC